MTRHAGKLAVWLVCLFAWSGVKCAALCAGEMSGKASNEMPCHPHSSRHVPARSCADQQFPQIDVPQAASAHAVCGWAAMAALAPRLDASANETCGAVVTQTPAPPGAASPPVLVLRI